MAVETDIQVLESKLTGLTRSFDQMAGQLTAKMDSMMSMQLQMARLQEQQAHMQAAQDRMFSAHEKHRIRIEGVETSVGKTLSFVRGTVLVGTVLCIFAQWYAVGQLDVVQETAKNVATNDRRIFMIEQDRLPIRSSGP